MVTGAGPHELSVAQVKERLHVDFVDSGELVQASQGRRIEDSSDLVQAHKEPLLHESEKGFTWTSVVESGWTEAGRQWF